MSESDGSGRAGPGRALNSPEPPGRHAKIITLYEKNSSVTLSATPEDYFSGSHPCFSVLFFFFPFIFISWRLITLQYCSGFCHTLT